MSQVAVLKWARMVLNKRLEEKPSGGIKTRLGGKETHLSYEDMIEELDELINAAEEGRLKVVTLCKDCKAFSGGPKSPRGCCFPKEYTSTRLATDYCSLCSKEGRKSAWQVSE